MRRLLVAIAPLLLSGCMSQTSVEAPDDCFVFCSQEQETTVRFDWVAPVLVLLVVVLVTGIIVAAAGGRGGDQQQQVVVRVEREEATQPVVVRQR